MLHPEVPILGYRESPRRRRDLPRLVMLLLRPLFRYSDWREAWVLRIVGERFGPVVRASPAGAAASLRPRAAPLATERPRRWVSGIPASTLLVACGIAVAVVLGFVVARTTSGGGSSLALGPRVAAGPVEAAFPRGWQLRPASSLARFGNVDGRAAVSGDRLIVVGTAATTDPSLLPPGILASVAGTPSGQLVTLRGTTYYRYGHLSLRAAKATESVYAAPASGGTVLAVCQAPALDAAFAGMCQRVVRSIGLRSGQLAPGLVPAYAAKLTAVIDTLNAARAQWGTQWRAASTARLQATATRQLAAAHTQAADALQGLAPGPAAGANAALVAALRLDAQAYSALARAASHRRIRAYWVAAAALARADNTLRSDLAALGSLGYRTSAS